MEESSGKWVFAIPIVGDINPLDLVVPYLRVIEDLPMSLWAFDELEIQNALTKVAARLTSGKKLTESELFVYEAVTRELAGAGLSLNDYELSLALEPTLIVILTP